MNLRLLLILSLFLTQTVIAQTNGKLSGWIVDKNTQKPIEGASIQLVNTKYKTISDAKGYYSFKNIPTGQYQVDFTSIGSIPFSFVF